MASRIIMKAPPRATKTKTHMNKTKPAPAKLAMKAKTARKAPSAKTAAAAVKPKKAMKAMKAAKAGSGQGHVKQKSKARVPPMNASKAMKAKEAAKAAHSSHAKSKVKKKAKARAAPGRKTMSPEEIRLAKKWYGQDVSPSAIAERLGRTKSTLTRLLVKQVARKPQGRPEALTEAQVDFLELTYLKLNDMQEKMPDLELRIGNVAEQLNDMKEKMPYRERRIGNGDRWSHWCRSALEGLDEKRNAKFSPMEVKMQRCMDHLDELQQILNDSTKIAHAITEVGAQMHDTDALVEEANGEFLFVNR